LRRRGWPGHYTSPAEGGTRRIFGPDGRKRSFSVRLRRPSGYALNRINQFALKKSDQNPRKHVRLARKE
jgi:hypothetical protein